jgi:hypothetical protein
MPTFNESERRKVFGVYTGCPCSIKHNKGIDTTDRNHNRKAFEKKVSDLIEQWHSSCNKFQPGPGVGSRFQENWNRSVKLLYGRSARITCIYDESGIGGEYYCKFSLKEEVSSDLDELDLNIVED